VTRVSPSYSQVSGQAQKSEDLIDRAVLNQLLEDVGLENAEALLDVFLEELAGQARALAEAAEQADLMAMGKAAHKLKGSAMTLGVVRLGRLVETIEAAARAGQPAAVTTAMADFHWLAQATQDAMRQIRNEGFGDTSQEGAGPA
jgi:HPt (histidine-containing phosphotransfer) domain-containing protein